MWLLCHPAVNQQFNSVHFCVISNSSLSCYFFLDQTTTDKKIRLKNPYLYFLWMITLSVCPRSAPEEWPHASVWQPCRRVYGQSDRGVGQPGASSCTCCLLTTAVRQGEEQTHVLPFCCSSLLYQMLFPLFCKMWVTWHLPVFVRL